MIVGPVCLILQWRFMNVCVKFALGRVLVGALASMLLFAGGCTTRSAMDGPRTGTLDSALVEAAMAPESFGSYPLRVGDSLDVKFFYDPQLNEHVVVRPDGRISLQLIGEVDAVGMTPDELRQDLVARYDGFLRDPEVAVIVREFTRGKIYVGGQVARPGEIELVGTMSALQAVMLAGGFNHGAEERSVVILRNRGGSEPAKFFAINLREQLDRVRYTDVQLEPSDILYVPQTQVAQVAEFFKEYVNEIIPIYRNMGLNFFYELNKKDTDVRFPITP
jgi:protein involved in polysaccharide export with SLBB domain